MQILVTGGSGFIGANYIEFALDQDPDVRIMNIDSLTYAANPKNNEIAAETGRYVFKKADIRDRQLIHRIFEVARPSHVVHFAAASHVDNSLVNPSEFSSTNVQGTINLLDAAVKYGVQRFVLVSTDEVYGQILDGSWDEDAILNPRNPYSASKAASEHFLQSYVNSFGLNASITRCSNNFGKYQHTEKFIPRSITRLLDDEPITLRGDGLHVREWIPVSDHCSAVDVVLRNGEPGGIYNVFGGTEMSNLSMALTLCNRLGKDPEKYITYIEDRPGHDRRYSIRSKRLLQLGYSPVVPFNLALDLTINYYKKQHLAGALAF